MIVNKFPFFRGNAITLINFRIGGGLYQAEAGMTFREWVNSAYNTGGFQIVSGYIRNSYGDRQIINATASTVIQENEYYRLGLL